MNHAATIFDSASEILVRISTPFATGNGVLLPQYGIVVTQEHIVRDTRYVIIEGVKIKRQKVGVVFLDEKHDLAFLEFVARDIDHPKMGMNPKGEVMALGLDDNLELAHNTGMINKVLDDLFIFHNAFIYGSVNGCCLFDEEGRLAGINTFLQLHQETFVKAISMHYIEQAIAQYKVFYPQRSVLCPDCLHLNVENTKYKATCNHCKRPLPSISFIEEYEPRGVELGIENVLSGLGFDAEICRRGYHKWELTEGSAKVIITYQEKTGFVVAEAILAAFPERSSTEILTYLLKQNYFNKGMSFSIKDHTIILSLIIYDQHLHYETCKKLIGNLIKSADRYDNILVNQFGAWEK